MKIDSPLTPTPAELAAFAAFRRAALQVRNASIISSGAAVGLRADQVGPGEIRTTFELLADEPFRSLAASVRLVYMQGEPANFYYICGLLHRFGSNETQARAASCRASYSAALNEKYIQFHLHGHLEGRTAGPSEIFEAWLYGVAFHQDPKHQPLIDELVRYMEGRAFPFAVNAVGLRLAGPVLDLDDVLADHLGAERVPRIEGSAS